MVLSKEVASLSSLLGGTESNLSSVTKHTGLIPPL